MKGKCYYCNTELNERTIKKHMKSCPEMIKAIEEKGKKSKAKRDQFIISLKDKCDTDTYCIYLSIDANLQLAHIDNFIREVWVECCGHLSCFVINKKVYNVNNDNSYEMNARLKDVLSINQKFEYKYDFGSTTELVLEVVDCIKVPKKFTEIEIIARNDEVKHKCCKCNKDAKYFNWSEEEYYCESCSQQCEEDEIDEVEYTNSPRDGVCAYDGQKNMEWPYLPGNDNEYRIIKENPKTDNLARNYISKIRNDGFDDYFDNELDYDLDDVDYLNEEDDEISDFDGLYGEDIFENGVFEESVEKMIEAGVSEEQVSVYINNMFKGFALDYIKGHGKTKNAFVKGKFSFDIYELIQAKTKNDIAELGENIGIKISLSLTKAKMIDKFMEVYEDTVIGVIKSIGQEDYNLLRKYLSDGGVLIASEENEEAGVSSTYFCSLGILYPFLKENNPAFVMPEVTQRILKKIDGFEIRKIIKENTKILSMFKGMINAYGVVSVKDVLNLFKRYGMEILESELMPLIARFINVPSMVYSVVDNSNGVCFVNYEVQSYEGICKAIDNNLDYAFIEEKNLRIMGEENYFDKTKFGERFIKEFSQLFGLKKSESLEIMHMMATDIQAYDVNAILEGFLKSVEGEIPEEDKFIIYNMIDDFTENIPLWIHKGYTKKEIESKDKQNGTAVNKVHVGRNDPCPCGSGKKYKKCCGRDGNVIQLGKI